ncbi:MAG: hypothetical protein ACI4P4_15490 [Faecousia sp.]
MNDFDFENLQKKIIGRSARNRVNGSRTTYVSLPSDNLSAAELKRRNGEVMVYKLGAPMSWESFKAMPLDLQRQYLAKLIEKYKANDQTMGEMFGVSGKSVGLYRRSIGVKIPNGGAARMSRADFEKWRAFVSGQELPAEDGEPVLDAAPETLPAEPSPVENLPLQSAPAAPAPDVDKKNAELCGGRLSFQGPAGDALRRVYELIGDAPVKLSVFWEVLGGGAAYD